MHPVGLDNRNGETPLRDLIIIFPSLAWDCVVTLAGTRSSIFIGFFSPGFAINLQLIYTYIYISFFFLTSANQKNVQKADIGPIIFTLQLVPKRSLFF